MPAERFDELRTRLLGMLDSLSSFALVLSRSREEAEDLVQIACLKALEHESQFETGTNLKAWVFTILRNEWINRSKQLSARSFVALEESLTLQTRNESEKQLERAWEMQKLRKAIFCLPEIHREVILLHDLEGLTYSEIGVVLECPIGTVMSRLQRGRAQLRKLYERNLAP